MPANRLSCLKVLAVAGAAVIVLLTACGDRGAEAPKGAAADAANAAGRCFFAVGHLSEATAELFAAAAAGDAERIGQALDAGADVNAADMIKRTPLFAAAFCDRAAAGELLVERGGNINAKDLHGFSALHAAVIAGSAAAAKALIAKGGDINIRSLGGRTPLHLAAATNQVALVDLLMEHGANTHLRGHDGRTAVALAAENGHGNIKGVVEKWLAKRAAVGKK